MLIVERPVRPSMSRTGVTRLIGPRAIPSARGSASGTAWCLFRVSEPGPVWWLASERFLPPHPFERCRPLSLLLLSTRETHPPMS